MLEARLLGFLHVGVRIQTSDEAACILASLILLLYSFSLCVVMGELLSCVSPSVCVAQKLC